MNEVSIAKDLIMLATSNKDADAMRLIDVLHAHTTASRKPNFWKKVLRAVTKLQTQNKPDLVITLAKAPSEKEKEEFLSKSEGVPESRIEFKINSDITGGYILDFKHKRVDNSTRGKLLQLFKEIKTTI